MRSDSGKGLEIDRDVVTEVTLLSDTVSVLGKLSEPNAKAANSAALDLSSETILMARSGL